MQPTPPEVKLAALAPIAFWLIAVLLILALGLRRPAIGRFRTQMIARWKPALAIAGLFALGTGLGDRGFLNPYGLAVFCQALIGLTLASSIEGFQPLPVTNAFLERRQTLQQVLLLILISVAVVVPALLIGTIGQSAMKYRSMLVSQHGGPEVLKVVERDLRAPAEREVRIKVLAASVSRPDVTVRRGKALYTGTPLEQKLSFTPGYSVVGEVDAVGAGVHEAVVGQRVGVLTIVGGYTEYLYWRSDRLIPVLASLDPAEEVPLVLDYIVAWQTMHRAAKVKPGEKTLIIGASGGIGTALLQLGRLAGLMMCGMASPSKHAILAEYSATPIDYRTKDFAEVIHRAQLQTQIAFPLK